jgi:hypothetical protein
MRPERNAATVAIAITAIRRIAAARVLEARTVAVAGRAADGCLRDGADHAGSVSREHCRLWAAKGAVSPGFLLSAGRQWAEVALTNVSPKPALKATLTVCSR